MSIRRLAISSGVCAATLLFAWSGLVAQPHDSAYLKIKVNPGRAGVFVDGKYLGPAANFRIARKYALLPGRHEIRLLDPRYEEASTTVDLLAGKTTMVSQTLKPLPVPKGPFGTLRTINSDKFAAVYINDKFYGHSDEFSNRAQGVLLPPGEYTVRIEPVSGGDRVARKVQIEVNKTVVVEK
ncbi:MAG: PEGA domain-containing protein [Acidobacteriia bacterium]|nr:PEGA domain-containing protein [Terriglobia bacterium]